MNREIEDGMGFAGLVGDTREERELERLQKRNRNLTSVLCRYMDAYPAFRIKPQGSPGSQVRDEQERLMAIEDAAQVALKL